MPKLRSFYLVVFTILLFWMSCDAKAEQRQNKVQKTKVNELTTLGIKMYDLNLDFINKFQFAIKSDSGETLEAGEGLFMELFNVPNSIFSAILNLDPDNIKAHLYLGKSYHRKSYGGEGDWNNDLAMKAKQEYLTALSLSKKVKTDKALMKDLTSELEDVEKILEGN